MELSQMQNIGIYVLIIDIYWAYSFGLNFVILCRIIL